MRKLKLQVQITVDGFVAAPNGELDWMTFNMDDKILECKLDATPYECGITVHKYLPGSTT